MSSTINWNSSSFQLFLEGWLVRQEHYLDELTTTDSNIYEKHDSVLRDLIERVLAHYQQYYEAKSLLSKQDVFILFSPVWFSSLEKSFLWITGFRPCLAIKIVKNSVNDLSEEQLEKIEKLKLEIKEEEKEFDEDLIRIQESLAAPPFSEIARRFGRLVMNGGNERRSRNKEEEEEEEEEFMAMLTSEMETLVERADFLRLKMTLKVIEILDSVQTVRFFVAVGKLQLRIRKLGFQRNARRNR
ncbi:protein DOG1-like 4 [Papaver somniferum]|uniref:protein DOG1-like 4 n=1 Tax=Papaver somniferum TaxID=3469 RepID=UPI000E6FDB22|nr:protein DOG1-like 4 [Papaver somniferum]